MALNPSRTANVSMGIIALLASSALLFLGTGIHPVWWLTWPALLPVLLVAARVSGLTAFGIAVTAWFLGTLNLWHYLRQILVLSQNPHAGPLVMPLGVVVGVLLMPSCVFGLAVLLWRGFARRGYLWRAAISLPAVWVTYEYLGSTVSPHGTFGNLAYTQMDCLPVLQLASLTGVWGVSFCLFFFPSALAALLSQNKITVASRPLAITTALMLLAILGFGWWRLRPVAAVHAVTVGLAASDAPQNVFPAEPEQSSRLSHDYLDQSRTLAAQGAQVIVLPEKLAVVVDPQTTDTDASFHAAAMEDKATIVVGVIRVSGNAKLNEARVYPPTNTAISTYEKQHMLPALESSFQVGNTRTLIQQPSGLWGVAICKDMDFPLLSRQYGQDGVGLLLVPAWDFGDDAWLHDRMAITRGVESGFSIARAAKQGLLTLSDDRGRVLAERSTASVPFVSIAASVPVRHDATLYSRCGDWLAQLNVAALGLIVLSLFVAKSRASPRA